MGRRKGAIEEWLKKVFFSGHKEQYIVFVKHRSDGEETLKPIPGDLIEDVRGGCIFIGDEVIPYHRVVEIRTKKGAVIYRRG
ncbi:MAG: RNA repair domain-containing protein [Desulfurococcaceae archaeon]